MQDWPTYVACSGRDMCGLLPHQNYLPLSACPFYRHRNQGPERFHIPLRTTQGPQLGLMRGCDGTDPSEPICHTCDPPLPVCHTCGPSFAYLPHLLPRAGVGVEVGGVGGCQELVGNALVSLPV